MNRNLITRILTGLIAGSVAVTALVISPWGVWLFCVLISLLGMWELMRTCGVESMPIRVVTLIYALCWWGLDAYSGLESQQTANVEWLRSLPMVASLVIFPCIALIALFSADLKDPVRQLSIPILSLVYVFFPFQLYYMMATDNYQSGDLVWEFEWAIPFGIIFLIWTLDSMAYFAGRFLGKRPLFERISPKKTWEGSIGGAIFCVAMGIGFNHWIPVAGWNWIMVAGIIAVMAQFGDLVESMIKRSLQLKDSGSILPGHGGILDRFDGFFFAVPFVFLYSSLV